MNNKNPILVENFPNRCRFSMFIHIDIKKLQNPTKKLIILFDARKIRHFEEKRNILQVEKHLKLLF